MKRFFIAACIAVLAILIVRSAARGATHICNATPNPIAVAIVTQQLEPTPTHGIYRGTFLISADTCETPLELTPQMGAVFIRYADTSEDNTWLGTTPTQDFEIRSAFNTFHLVESKNSDATVVLLAPDASLIL